jgi:hypothetical protein
MTEALALGLLALAYALHRRNAYRFRWTLRLAEIKGRTNQ